MSDINHIKKTPEHTLEKMFVDLCRSVTAKRPRTVINHILQHGIITNDELSEVYGYGHPPRAIRDVRENGIPIITHSVTSPKSGGRMAAYTFDDISKIKRGRIGGRQAFSKDFKKKLIALYGSRDAVTGVVMDDRYLQIDHRVPYEVIGDDPAANGNLNPNEFMLLEASSNRAKSWSCESCNNFLNNHDVSVCRECFWAFPESYSHIAEIESRRVDIVWTGDESKIYDKLKKQADDNGIDIRILIKEKLKK